MRCDFVAEANYSPAGTRAHLGPVQKWEEFERMNKRNTVTETQDVRSADTDFSTIFLQSIL